MQYTRAPKQGPAQSEMMKHTRTFFLPLNPSFPPFPLDFHLPQPLCLVGFLSQHPQLPHFPQPPLLIVTQHFSQKHFSQKQLAFGASQ